MRENNTTCERYLLGVVVLNYCTYENTVNCINSYLNMAGKKIFVVVVDNGSSDFSGDKLEECYRTKTNVVVIKNKCNLGFSSGMNIGYCYAKRVLHCDFIVMSNSDIIMKTDGFVAKIIYSYKKYGYAVLGPYIDNLNSESNEKNPYLTEILTPQEKYRITKRKLILRQIKLCATYAYCEKIYDNLLKISRIIYSLLSAKYRSKTNTHQNQMKVINDIYIDTALHGSMFVLSPKFVTTFDGLNSITFMYQEEWLLYNQCKEQKLILIYDPSIKVLHLDGGGNSFKALHKNERKRLINRLKTQNKSDKIVLQFIKDRW